MCIVILTSFVLFEGQLSYTVKKELMMKLWQAFNNYFRNSQVLVTGPCLLEIEATAAGSFASYIENSNELITSPDNFCLS